MSTPSENPQAKMTDAKSSLWAALCAANLSPVKFHPQHNIGGYTVDFCAPDEKLIVEVNDPQTIEQDEFYVMRNALFKAEGWRLLRFTDHDALKNTEAVLSVILAVIHKDDPATVRSAGKSLEGFLDFEI